MKFSELDTMMRAFEYGSELRVLPHNYVVARMDGRSFTRLTKEELPFERPFDPRFRDAMVATASHLMNVGFDCIYGHTHSDEISLLVSPLESAFGRRVVKIASILAGEASAKFVTAIGAHGIFDCRLSVLPTIERVVDYFRWRAEDANRNALNSYGYWALRAQQQTPQEATKRLQALSKAEKNEILFRLGVNYNDLPSWQKRGIGLRWQVVETPGQNPMAKSDNADVLVTRRRLVVDDELPMKEQYGDYVRQICREAESSSVACSAAT